MAEPDPLPVACTLGPSDATARLHRWRALADRGEPVISRQAGRLEVRYEAGSGVLEELAALVDAESQCCGFVQWRAELRAGSPTLTVTAAPGDPAAIDAVAAWFGCG